MAKYIFLVTVHITSELEEWDYKPNSEIIVPVLTNNFFNARRKIEKRFWGSEYPCYRIGSIHQCDDFLFKPILT